MVIKVMSGFQEVQMNIFRKKSISKGQKLFNSFHVSDVHEEIRDNDLRLLFGNVLRETPGISSTKSKQNIYKVTVELNPDRSIKDTMCSCKGGRGFCKHAAAICIYVNVENTCSKTDQPMIWNRPSEEQLKKYSKGCQIRKMRNPDDHFPKSPIFTIENLQNVSDDHLAINCSMTQMIKAEKKCSVERLDRERKRIELEKELRKVLEVLLELQLRSDSAIYHAYEMTIQNFKLRLKAMTCPPEYLPTYSLITVDKNKWIEICLSSVEQSQTSVWFTERLLRVTCSTRAHRIKTRSDNFEDLARQFKNDKFKGNLTPAMRYGLDMEPIARSVFEENTGFRVHQVGLVISLKQPFLACSPDGIIINDGNVQLLEIKCPSSCQDTKIIDYEKREIQVPYLKFNNDDEVILYHKDKYYTQIQVSMYILGITSCHLFVYSAIDYVHVLVHRDEEFLQTLIPKIENFYFKYFIPLLNTRQADF